MEISFKRVCDVNSGKPPINGSNRKVVTINTTKAVSADKAGEHVKNFFREHANPKVKQNNGALKTLDSDVFVIRGESAKSATITKSSYDKLHHKSDKEHRLTEINLQPENTKKQAAIYFDKTAMQGKDFAGIEIDRSTKGRVKIKIKTLDVMA